MDLLEQAMAAALPNANDAMFAPMAVIEDPAGKVIVATIVTDASDRAAALGRKIVREQADAAAYVIVTRTNLVVDDDGNTERVLLYETARKGDGLARKYADRLPPDSQRQELEPVPTAFGPVDPWALMWTAAMPDRFNPGQNVALHIVNHALSDDNVDRTLRFLQNRIRFQSLQLPSGCTCIVAFDDRGQEVADTTRDLIRRSLEPLCRVVQFFTEG